MTTPPQASSAAVSPNALTSTGAATEPAAMPPMKAGSASPGAHPREIRNPARPSW
jgi:hypothetical protein